MKSKGKKMNCVKKIFNTLTVLFIIFPFGVNSQSIYEDILVAQYVPPQDTYRKSDVKVDTSPETLVTFYEYLNQSLIQYDWGNKKCSQYFKETNMERERIQEAKLLMNQIKFCYKSKTGNELTDAEIKKNFPKDRMNKNFTAFSSISSMMMNVDKTSIDPYSKRDSEICAKKIEGVSSMYVMATTTLKLASRYPEENWCQRLN